LLVLASGLSILPISLTGIVQPVEAQTNETQKAEAERLLKLCREDLGKNQPEAAIQSCQQAVTAHQQIKDRTGEAKSTVNLGTAYSRSGQYSQAIPILESALKLAREAKERRGEAIALQWLGIAYVSSWQSQQGTEFLQQALTVAQEIKDADLEAGIRQILSEVEAERPLTLCQEHLEKKQFDNAIQSCQQAVTAYRQIQDRLGEAKSMANLGIAYGFSGQSDRATSTLETVYK
jgi:tetratricopeptide (TPR) repeat protein